MNTSKSNESLQQSSLEEDASALILPALLLLPTPVSPEFVQTVSLADDNNSGFGSLLVEFALLLAEPLWNELLNRLFCLFENGSPLLLFSVEVVVDEDKSSVL